MRLTPPVPAGLSILHKLRSQRYHMWNSVRGMLRAWKMGATSIDIDMTATREGEKVANHWSRMIIHDGFRDPLRKLAKRIPIRRVRLKVVKRLVAGKRRFRIVRIVFLIRVASRLKTKAGNPFTLCLEAKPDDPRFKRPEFWADLVAAARKWKVPIIIMCQPHAGQGYRILAAVHVAGIPTLLLTREEVPAEVWQHLDFVKGPRKWTEPGRPERVKRLGAGARDATQWGASCHATALSVKRTNRAIQKAQKRKEAA